MTGLLLFLSLLAGVQPRDACGHAYPAGIWHSDDGCSTQVFTFADGMRPATFDAGSFEIVRMANGRLVLTIPDDGTLGQECLGGEKPKRPLWPSAAANGRFFLATNSASSGCVSPRYVDVYTEDQKRIRVDRSLGISTPCTKQEAASACGALRKDRYCR